MTQDTAALKVELTSWLLQPMELQYVLNTCCHNPQVLREMQELAQDNESLQDSLLAIASNKKAQNEIRKAAILSLELCVKVPTKEMPNPIWEALLVIEQSDNTNDTYVAMAAWSVLNKVLQSAALANAAANDRTR